MCVSISQFLALRLLSDIDEVICDEWWASANAYDSECKWVSLDVPENEQLVGLGAFTGGEYITWIT